MLRVANVSSPRSGNNWVRGVLSAALELEPLAVHDFAEVCDLPSRCAFQCHWYREPHYQRFLNENNFRALVIARHPLDILLSVLHFVRHEPQTRQWLLGNCEIPDELSTSDSASAVFRDYCLSWGAENLLSVTYQWWHDQDVLKTRYEDLVADPLHEMGLIIRRLGGTADRLRAALEEKNFATFQASPNRRGWRGRPGHWVELMPNSFAQEVYRKHRHIFEFLEYEVPRTDLSETEAQENWARAVIAKSEVNS